MSASTQLRRDLVTLSHYDVLHILTNVQEPKCLASEVKGVRADLASIEKAGTWFLMARFDEMALDTYAMSAARRTTGVLHEGVHYEGGAEWHGLLLRAPFRGIH
ncbi:hypothetical protein ANCCEY_04310 [Ancylostoma ceylanicum]|uniref:Uncharacterized protein n=1 Tax=Ancylostoma ceylanicum TaxID=53326 RepID=A0A0D6M2Q2_9BILA|nr:hypothetical protein ANCCEY_04310 [Ancylostoma ceylanicum]